MKVKVDEVLAGEGLNAGEVVTVLEGFGFTLRDCLTETGGLAAIGQRVEVLAGPGVYIRYSICEKPEFFERPMSSPKP